MLDQDQNLLGRSPADRFVYKVPVCKDVKCGYTGEAFERKYRQGCVFRDTLERDQGELSYPKIVNGKPSVYESKENCIWHIQASSPNKWLKVIIFNIINLNLTAYYNGLLRSASLSPLMGKWGLNFRHNLLRIISLVVK